MAFRIMQGKVWTLDKKRWRGALPLISQHSSLAAIHIEVVYIVSVCMFIHFATIFSYSLFTSTEQLPFITALPHIALTLFALPWEIRLNLH